MTRFFFHYREGEDYAQDSLGIPFSTVEEAFVSAFEGAADMWSELLRERRDPRRCSFEVSDERGQILFILPFIEVLESCRDNRASYKAARAEAFQAVLAAGNRTRQSFTDFRRELKVTQGALTEAKDLIAALNRLNLPS